MHGTHEHGHHQHEAHAGHAAPTPSAHRGDHSGPAADAHSGDDQHAGHSPEMFRDRFWLSLLLTVPVVVWSPHIEELLGYSAPRFPYSHQVPTVLGTAVFLYGGLVFLRSALGNRYPTDRGVSDASVWATAHDRLTVDGVGNSSTTWRSMVCRSSQPSTFDEINTI